MEDTNHNEQHTKGSGTLTEEHHTNLGPILGILLIILVLILGGLYLWGAALDREMPAPEVPTAPNNEPETPRADADVQILKTVSSSDSLDAIETDINSTNLDSLDAELPQMQQEFNSTN